MFLARRQVRQIVTRVSGRLWRVAAAKIVPEGVERGATAMSDAEQKAEPLPVFGIFRQPAAVTACAIIPVEIRAARQIAIPDMRLHARVRQTAPAAADAGQGTQNASRLAA
ncbi:hypothetical protein NY78_1671 [Desulfovibrio sp. TomC]|nr:hypothetical protein NY78_1671 [Desulfovibrio sp. TomC]